MREVFIKKLTELATKDERIVLLTGDLGFGVVEEFIRLFPKRFYNVGISEQNMIGIATGLAKDRYIPFCYSIAPFTLLRPYEFIKNGPVLHNLKVRIIATGGGFEYGNAGQTHYCLEDVAITRVFPNLESYFPINANNSADLLEKTYNNNAPIYYRIGKNKSSLSDEIIESSSNTFLETLYEKETNKTAVICLSSSVEEGIKALEIRKNEFNLYAITKINPIPMNAIKEIIKKHKKIITVEACYLNGGLGSILSEIITDNCIEDKKLIRLAVRGEVKLNGDQNFMKKEYLIDCQSIINNL